MKIYFDTGVWSQLARDPSGTDRLSALVRRRRDQVFLSATAWGEIHGIGEQERSIYDAFTRALRAVAWDRIPRDALELLTLEFVRYSARILGGDYAREAGALDGSLFTDLRFSQTQDLSPDPELRQELVDARSRNRETASRFRRPSLDSGEFDQRAGMYREHVRTQGAAAVLARLERMPADQRICPFIASFRRDWADLETQSLANDWLLLNAIARDASEMANAVDEPWDTPATRFLKRHGSSFNGDFWRRAAAAGIDDDSILIRNRTKAYVLHYLVANGFAGEGGSFWYDLQHAVYAHDVSLYFTTDGRFSDALCSEYLQRHFARRGGANRVVHVQPDLTLPRRVFDTISR